MEDPKWLRILTIGLILAALAVGYFLFSGRFLSNNATKISQQESTPSPQATASASPSPTVLGKDTQVSPTPSSAFNRIAQRNKGGVETLPKTGFGTGLAFIFSVSALISGWSLRKFPR